jgi:hypothetical protein
MRSSHPVTSSLRLNATVVIFGGWVGHLPIVGHLMVVACYTYIATTKWMNVYNKRKGSYKMRCTIVVTEGCDVLVVAAVNRNTTAT